MKYLLFIVLLVAVVITAGCMSGDKNTAVTPTQTTTTSSITIPTTVSPLPTANTPIESITSVQPTIQITSDDIRQHFMDIAFGAGSNSLNRLPNDYSYSSNYVSRGITRIAINYPKANYAQDSDPQVLQNFASEFNKYSKTLKLRENRWDSPSELSFDVVSPSDFTNIIKSPSIIAHNGVIYAKADYPTHIIISKDLTGDERNYTIVRGLLYALGFRGETLKYKDSFFYTDNINNSNLSYIDKKAIEIMYGPGMYPGMTVEDAKKIVSPK
jgi:hypothetical protein